MAFADNLAGGNIQRRKQGSRAMALVVVGPLFWQTRRLLYLLNPTAGSYYSTITTMDDGVNTNYQAPRLSIQHRFSHNFTLLSVYTYSHCLETGEVIADRLNLGANTYQNPANRNADYGDCDAGLRQYFVNSVVYQTPKFTNRGASLLLGDWQLSFLITAHSEFPFYPTPEPTPR